MNRIHYLFLVFFALLACIHDQPEGAWTHYYEMSQCADPWEGSPDDQQLLANIESYLNEHQIEVEAISLHSYELGAVCLACQCSAGRRINVIADEANGKRLLKLEVPGSTMLRWKTY